MKIDVLSGNAGKYDTSLEILPKYSTPIVVAGKAKGIKNVDSKAIFEKLKGIRGIYKEVEETNGKKQKFAFCLYKAGFKTFLDDSFIYYEHYIADYSLSATEIVDRLQRKKKLAEEHLTNILSSLDKEELVKMTFLSLFRLDKKKHQEIKETIIKRREDIVQDEQTLTARGFDYNRFNFDICLYNGDVCFTSICDWKDCHFGMTSFIYTTKGVLPNPSINNVRELVERAYNIFLEKCNIVSVDVLREQNKTLLKRLMFPIHMFVIPLLLLTLYIGLSTKDILGICGAIGICSLILGTCYWLKEPVESVSKM